MDLGKVGVADRLIRVGKTTFGRRFKYKCKIKIKKMKR